MVAELLVSWSREHPTRDEALLPRPMQNALLIGSSKEPLSRYIPHQFLLIDDGPFIDAFELPRHRVFDPTTHSFNPLRGMDYGRARQFWDVLKAVFPEGESTLTKATAEFQILTALLAKPKSLETLISDTKDTQYAYQLVRKLLLSPVLERVLKGPTNFSFKGTIVARLDRSVLGDFDCFVLGNLLISQYPGTVVVPDFGFYACPSHISLIRQERLVAGINSFEEVPALRNALLLIEEKIGSRCTPADAELLALYAGIAPNSNAYNDFIQASIGRA